jgi:energy-coupling factor transporter transmembrane protein EcfT
MFEFLIGLLAGLMAGGTIWFWLLVAAVFIAVTVLVESECGGWATLTLIVTGSLGYFVFGGQRLPLKQVVVHPWYALGWIGIYFVLGVVWGLFKWFVYVHKRLGLYREARDLFLKDSGAAELTPLLAVSLMKDLASRYAYGEPISAAPPRASQHKGDIIRWMSYWPFSVIGTVLNDFVRKAWNHIYNFTVQTYDRIAAHVFRKYAGDVAMAKQGEATAEADSSSDRSDRRRR